MEIHAYHLSLKMLKIFRILNKKNRSHNVHVSVIFSLKIWNKRYTNKRSDTKKIYTKIVFIFLESTLYEGWNSNSDNYLFTTDTK